MWLAYLASREFASIAFICKGITMRPRLSAGSVWTQVTLGTSLAFEKLLQKYKLSRLIIGLH